LREFRLSGRNALEIAHEGAARDPLAALSDLVAPGPTFTNVNDFRVILVSGR